MSRTRLISDIAIFGIVRALLARNGPRGVTFASVAQKSGLSGPSLVQRYGSLDAMMQSALLAGWDALDRATEVAVAAAPKTGKGAVALLKALDPQDLARPASELAVLLANLKGPLPRARATRWHDHIVAALAVRIGAKDPDRAEMLFAAWQGRMLWSAAGVEGFRLRDLQKLVS